MVLARPSLTCTLTSRHFEPGDLAFELVLHPVDVTATKQWCHFTFDLGEMDISGRPDPSQIRSLEVQVPAYEGSGSGNTIWLDGVSFR